MKKTLIIFAILMLIIFSCGKDKNNKSSISTFIASLITSNANAKAMAIATGSNHTCVILEDGDGDDSGDVKCWGDGEFGQHGYGNTDTINASLNVPVDLGEGRTAKKISAGGFHTCAILDDNTVKCWGKGYEGQLGYGNMYGEVGALLSIGDNESPGSIGVVDIGSNASAIIAGHIHTCVILDDGDGDESGDVKCWGRGSEGQHGYGISSDITMPMNDIVNLGNISGTSTPLKAKALSAGAGGFHTCAILSDDTVKCWGRGRHGQLGYGDFYGNAAPDTPNNLGANPATTPDMLAVVGNASGTGTPLEVKAISAGQDHTCAILSDDTVKCWGQGEFGQLGYGDEFSRGHNVSTTPDMLAVVGNASGIGTPLKAKAIDTGSQYTCVILKNGDVKCWGIGDDTQGGGGQLGYGHFYGNRSITIDGVTTIVPNHLGHNATTTPDMLMPVNLGAGQSAMNIDLGAFHTCVLLDNKAVKCWGLGSFGQLGYGNTNNLLEPGAFLEF